MSKPPSDKPMSNSQAKQHLGKALAESLGIPVTLTKAGQLTVETRRAINDAGYFWFPGERTFRRLTRREETPSQ